jgi:ribosome-associated protein
MSPEELKRRISPGEIVYSASRSGGPGGQNVNKVSTKVELRFNVMRSRCLTIEEKERITNTLKGKINSEGDLLIVSQSERSQLMNRKKSEEKFFALLSRALTKKAERKPSAPTKASRVRRLEGKKMRSRIKKLRMDSSSPEKEE